MLARVCLRVPRVGTVSAAGAAESCCVDVGACAATLRRPHAVAGAVEAQWPRPASCRAARQHCQRPVRQERRGGAGAAERRPGAPAPAGEPGEGLHTGVEAASVRSALAVGLGGTWGSPAQHHRRRTPRYVAPCVHACLVVRRGVTDCGRVGGGSTPPRARDTPPPSPHTLTPPDWNTGRESRPLPLPLLLCFFRRAAWVALVLPPCARPALCLLRRSAVVASRRAP
jgi:hypothetical protein